MHVPSPSNPESAPTPLLPSAEALPGLSAEVSSGAQPEAGEGGGKRKISKTQRIVLDKMLLAANPSNRGPGEATKIRMKKRDPRAIGYTKGMADQIEKHPQRDEIDKAILTKSMKAEEICKKWGFSGVWVVYRRKVVHKSRLRELKRKRDRIATYNREQGAEKRTLGLLDWALDASKQGFEKIMSVADNPADIERGGTFLDKYMASVKLFGNATGELTPEGGPPQGVNIDNRQMYVMAMPRIGDPQSVIDESEAMVRNVGAGRALPRPEEVIDLKAEPMEDDLADLDDSDFSSEDLALLQGI